MGRGGGFRGGRVFQEEKGSRVEERAEGGQGAAKRPDGAAVLPGHCDHPGLRPACP